MPLQPIKFVTTLNLATLASNTALTTPTVDSLEQDFHIVSTDLLCSLAEMTINEGPLDFGLAEQGYTAAEIVECLDASPLSQYGPEMERSKRRVRLYGRFPGDAISQEVNDGESIRRKMFLRTFGTSNFAAARVFIVNRDSNPLTTGGILKISGTHWGRWV